MSSHGPTSRISALDWARAQASKQMYAALDLAIQDCPASFHVAFDPPCRGDVVRRCRAYDDASGASESRTIPLYLTTASMVREFVDLLNNIELDAIRIGSQAG